jgi:hypothetical protein
MAQPEYLNNKLLRQVRNHGLATRVLIRLDCGSIIRQNVRKRKWDAILRDKIVQIRRREMRESGPDQVQ